MTCDASKFIQNRHYPLSITNNRIKHILWYLIECHKLFSDDRITYSEDWVRRKTTHKFEDFLKFRFIEDYLIPNKSLIRDKISDLEEINFLAETQKSFIDTKDEKEKPDEIDIFINKLGLQKEWNEEDENIYFALECKRIRKLSDTSGYISDIEKFSKRNHTNLRLPFEGQIAFIENKSLNHNLLSNEINKKLDVNSQIITNSKLKQINLHKTFEGSYISKHKKNSSSKNRFTIYHLLFDYSNVVLN